MRYALYIQEAAGESDLVRDALLEAGCDVRLASASEALVILRGAGRTPDLAILELGAPADFVRCRDIAGALPTTPLIVIAEEAQLPHAFEAGADDCVVAPVRRGELVARVNAAFADGPAANRRTKREKRLTDEVSELRRQKSDLERIACVDSLTGVANRRHALSLLQAEWKRSAREGSPLSLVMVDLDCFHAFNETYGHLGGDSCLRRVADTMARCLRRPSDFLGRYGGEEFIAVLAQTDAEGAQIVAERMRAAVEALAIPHETSTCSTVVTTSIGFATSRASLEDDAEALVSAADRALLTSKASGRNRVTGEASPSGERRRLPSQPWRRFPVVVADPWFADRIPQFLATTRTDVRVARESLAAASYDKIRAIGRRLRVGAGEHAIEALADLAALLERSARSEDRDSLERVIDELEAYVEHVQVTYRRPLERKLEAG